MIVIRKMTREDIPSGLLLCRHAGWNQLSRDWDTFLQMNPGGCRVAVDENDNIAGTFTTVPYQDRFSWIGMVLVHPEYRRKGIGTLLLKEALSLLSDHVTIKLDATPQGRDVYLKLNFVDEYGIVRMRRPADSVEYGATTVARPMVEEDFSGILKLDRAVFGADRKFILERSFEGAPQYAFVTEKHGEITGFCMGRPGYDSDHIGPVIARESDDAIHLFSGALAQRGGRPLIVDALQHTPEWLDFLSKSGFVPLRPLIRMFRGSNLYPGVSENQFSILGPEFG